MDDAVRSRTLAQLERAVEERTYLLRISDVLGHAVGFRFRGGKVTEEPVLTVYVRPGRKKQVAEDFPCHQRIPSRNRLKVDGRTVWLPVDIVESGLGELCTGSIQSGLSVGNSLRQDSGTIGWIARTDDDQGASVFCSAFHVLLRFNGSKLSGSVDKQYEFVFPDFEHVLCPSTEDGGTLSDDKVGYVLAGRRNKLVDVAVVLPQDGDLLEAAAAQIGPLGPQVPGGSRRYS